MAADLIIGLFFLIGGLGGIVFREPLLRSWKRHVDLKWNPRLRPTDRFIEGQHMVVSVLSVGTGAFIIVIALV
jgi:hypothetical protein